MPALPPAPVQAVSAASYGEQLTEAKMRALYAEASVPLEWVEPLLAIAFCESGFWWEGQRWWQANAVGDGGASLGVHQIWTGWFAAAGYSLDEWSNPLINTKVALYVRATRGRFGGGGGWTCATILGIW